MPIDELQGRYRAKLAYCLWLTRANAKGDVHASTAQLGEWLGEPEKTVRRAVADLEEAGLVKAIRSGRVIIGIHFTCADPRESLEVIYGEDARAALNPTTTQIGASTTTSGSCRVNEHDQSGALTTTNGSSTTTFGLGTEGATRTRDSSYPSNKLEGGGSTRTHAPTREAGAKSESAPPPPPGVGLRFPACRDKTTGETYTWTAEVSTLAELWLDLVDHPGFNRGVASNPWQFIPDAQDRATMCWLQSQPAEVVREAMRVKRKTRNLDYVRDEVLRRLKYEREGAERKAATEAKARHSHKQARYDDLSSWKNHGGMN